MNGMRRLPSMSRSFLIKSALSGLLVLALAGGGIAEANPQSKPRSKPAQGKLIRKDVLKKYEGVYEVDDGGQVRKMSKKRPARSKVKTAKKAPKKSVSTQERKRTAKAQTGRKQSSAKTSRVQTAKKNQVQSGRRPASIRKSESNRKTQKPVKKAKAAPKSKASSVKRKQSAKKVVKKTEKKTVKKSAKKAEKRTAKKSVKKPQSPRLTYAKEAANERDMPFISVPTSRVVKETQIEMEDPATQIDPDWDSTAAQGSEPESGVLDPVSSADREASESSDRVPSSMVEPAPAAATPEEVYGPPVREPDAFDLHSGADPLAR
jgi:hypothetical protein